MEPLRPGSLGSLTDAQRDAFESVVAQLYQSGFDNDAVKASIPDWIDRLAPAFDGVSGFGALYDEIRRWVYWTCVPGYWLGYLLEEFAKQRFLLGRYWASLLYAIAQESVGDDDHAQATLELAYYDAVLNKVPANWIAAVEQRLRHYHRYYLARSRSASIFDANPLLSFPYHYRTWSSLRTEFPSLPLQHPQATVAELEAVVAACSGEDHTYHRVIARRWMASSLAVSHRSGEALNELALALEEARTQILWGPLTDFLDAEVGHLHRLRGEIFRKLLRLDEAEQEHRRGLAHEESHAPYCALWRALSAKCLGRVLLERSLFAGLDDNLMHESFRAFAVGREALDAHIRQTDMPVARSSALQLMRGFSDGLVDLASCSLHGGSPPDRDVEQAIAEVESLAPRGAADSLAELVADSGSGEEMQQLRAVFHRHLTTVPESFDEYRDSIVAERELRRAYRATRRGPTVRVAAAVLGSSTVAARRLLALRIPNTSVAVFHVDDVQGRIIVIDLDDDHKATHIGLHVGEVDLRALCAQLREDTLLSRGSPLRNGPAVRAMLIRAGVLLGGPLHELAERVAGRHVKLVTRGPLSQLPLHAVLTTSGRLIDRSDVSYGPGLALVATRDLLKPETSAPRAADGLVVIHNADDTHYLSGAVDAVGDTDGTRILRNPDEASVLDVVRDPNLKDLVFACHGVYVPDDPTDSYLRVAGRLRVRDLFVHAKLSQCRSVMLAACSSAQARAEIASESVGLVDVFLGAGSRTVVGSLWEVNELATALLLDSYTNGLLHDLAPVTALNVAQRLLATVSADEVREWIGQRMPDEPERKFALSGDDFPFAAPVHWAGFVINGAF